MTAAQIAADVAARYGLPIMDGAVKVCPPNTYTWQIECRNDEVKTWEELKSAFYRNRARVQRIAKAATPEVAELSTAIVRMYQAGSAIADIHRALNTSMKNIRNKLRAAGVYDPERSKEAQKTGATKNNKARARASKASQAARVAQTQEGRAMGKNVGVR